MRRRDGEERVAGDGALRIAVDEHVPLADRVRIANEAGADVFVSIHCNAMEKREDRKVTRGVETYFLSPDPTDAEARMLAQLENGGPDAVPLPKAADPVAGILNDLALGQARNDSAALAQIVQRHYLAGRRLQRRVNVLGVKYRNSRRQFAHAPFDRGEFVR